MAVDTDGLNPDILAEINSLVSNESFTSPLGGTRACSPGSGWVSTSCGQKYPASQGNTLRQK